MTKHWVQEARERAEEAQRAYDDLKSKYEKALRTLQTISNVAAASGAPTGWAHQVRMAWTAANCLKELASQEQRGFPIWIL